MAGAFRSFAVIFFVLIGTVSHALSQNAELPSFVGKTEQTGYRAAEFWFNSLSVEDRIKIQFALIWTNSFNGFVDGLFGPQTDRALRHFENQIGANQDGQLSDTEKTNLLTEAAREMDELSFRIVVDSRTNLEFGLPQKLFGQGTRSLKGTSWESTDGAIHLFTERIPSAEVTYEQLYELLTYETTTRLVTFAKFRPDFFVVAGVDSGQKFHLKYLRLDRASGGILITWSNPEKPEMSKLVSAISNSFAFQASNSIVALPDVPPATTSSTAFSKFGTGFFVSAIGHVLTNEHVVRGCTKAVIRLRMEELCQPLFASNQN